MSGYLVTAKDEWVSRNGLVAEATLTSRDCKGCQPVASFTASDGSFVRAVVPGGRQSTPFEVRYPSEDPASWVIQADDDLVTGASGLGLLIGAVLAWFTGVAWVTHRAARTGRQQGLLRALGVVVLLVAVEVRAAWLIPLPP